MDIFIIYSPNIARNLKYRTELAAVAVVCNMKNISPDTLTQNIVMAITPYIGANSAQYAVVRNCSKKKE